MGKFCGRRHEVLEVDIKMIVYSRVKLSGVLQASRSTVCVNFNCVRSKYDNILYRVKGSSL